MHAPLTRNSSHFLHGKLQVDFSTVRYNAVESSSTKIKVPFSGLDKHYYPRSPVDIEVGDITGLPEGMIQTVSRPLPPASCLECKGVVRCTEYRTGSHETNLAVVHNGLCVKIPCYFHSITGNNGEHIKENHEKEIAWVIQRTIESNFFDCMFKWNAEWLHSQTNALTQQDLNLLREAVEGVLFTMNAKRSQQDDGGHFGPNNISAGLRRFFDYFQRNGDAPLGIRKLIFHDNVERLSRTQFTTGTIGGLTPNRRYVNADGTPVSESVKSVSSSSSASLKYVTETGVYVLFNDNNSSVKVNCKYGSCVLELQDAILSSGRFKDDDGSLDWGASAKKRTTITSQLSHLLPKRLRDPLMFGGGAIKDTVGLYPKKILDIVDRIYDLLRYKVYARDPNGFAADEMNGFKDGLKVLGLTSVGEKALEDAKKALEDAEKAQEEVPANADADAKNKAEEAVNKAKEAVNNAEEAVNNADKAAKENAEKQFKSIVDSAPRDVYWNELEPFTDPFDRAEFISSELTRGLSGFGYAVDRQLRLISKEKKIFPKMIKLLVLTVLVNNGNDAPKVSHDVNELVLDDDKNYAEFTKRRLKAGSDLGEKIINACKLVGAGNENIVKEHDKNIIDFLNGKGRYILLKALKPPKRFETDISNTLSIGKKGIFNAYMGYSLAGNTRERILQLVRNEIPLPFGVGAIGWMQSCTYGVYGYDPNKTLAMLGNELSVTTKLDGMRNELETYVYTKTAYLTSRPDHIVASEKGMYGEIKGGFAPGFMESPQSRRDRIGKAPNNAEKGWMGFFYAFSEEPSVFETSKTFDITGYFRHYNRLIPSERRKGVSYTPHFGGGAFLSDVLGLVEDKNGTALGPNRPDEIVANRSANARADIAGEHGDVRVMHTTLMGQYPCWVKDQTGKFNKYVPGLPSLEMFGRPYNEIKHIIG